MILNLRATNSNGLSINFDDSIRVTSGLDLSGLTARVNTTQTSQAGSKYQNTKLLERNIDLEFQIRRKFYTEETMDALRELMYQVFNPELGIIRFDFNLTDGREFYFNAYSTSSPVMPPNKSNNNDAFQLALVQLICTDPYIYDSFTSNTEVATYVGGFIFPLEIPEGVGIEMGTRSESLVANVLNRSNGDIGFTVVFKARGNLSNPSITNVNTFERLGINFNMIAGDEVTINTARGNRSITLVRNNVSQNLFNTFDFLNSTFFQLHPGENLIRYDATTNLDSLEVSIQLNNRYVGV